MHTRVVVADQSERSPRKHEAETFARTIVGELDKARNAGEFDRSGHHGAPALERPLKSSRHRVGILGLAQAIRGIRNCGKSKPVP
jgi:hypothetical protein